MTRVIFQTQAVLASYANSLDATVLIDTVEEVP
jgi:hypothetical protein